MSPKKSSKKEPRAPRRLTAAFFPNAYRAQRATGHKAMLFLEEARTLAGYKQQVAAQRDIVDRQWATGDREQIVQGTQTLLAACVDELEFCHDAFKIAARERLEKAATFRDSKDRENVTVALTQMTTAIEDMERRLIEARDKAGFNTKDALALEAAIEEHERDFKQLRGKLVDSAGKLNIQLTLFAEPARVSRTVDREVQGLLRAMKLEGPLLPRVTLRPFTTFGRAMEQQYAALKVALCTGSRNDAVSAFTAMHVLGKFQAASTCTERIRQLLMDGSRIPVRKLQHYIVLLREILEERQVFPECNVPNLQQPFADLLAWVQNIETLLRAPDTTHGMEWIMSIQEAMDQCDPEAMVLALQRKAEELTS
jgi:hypothetical protein